MSQQTTQGQRTQELPEQGFELQLEESVKRFYDILRREPRFYHDPNDESSSTCVENVWLVFGDGKEVRLHTRGISAHDYDGHGSPKYQADSTAAQIEAIAKDEQREPAALHYRFNDQHGRAAKPQFLLRFPYKFVREIIEGKTHPSPAEAPYEVLEVYGAGSAGK